MTIARKYLIDTSKTCYYHCMSRCVAQQFLLKKAPEPRVSRLAWIEKWLLFLGNTFAIDILSYSIMGNHTHTVLHINLDLLKSWTDVEVLNRRLALGNIPDVCHSYLCDNRRREMSELELALVFELVCKYREELSSISIFMKRLNSYIAVRANREDKRTGHFWEGRFKSHALLDEKAVLACMAYVDLNPIRAGLCFQLLKSNYTSIKQRLSKSSDYDKSTLLPFRDSDRFSNKNWVSQIKLTDYKQLLENTLARKAYVLEHKTFDSIASNLDDWFRQSLEFEDQNSVCAGDKKIVKNYLSNIKQINQYSEKALADITFKILCELRDIQYQCDKTSHPS